jgi:hypothetical protein
MITGKKMKYILNKTKQTSERYSLIDEGMGGFGDPDYYPTHKYSVVWGVDRGNGYQGYLSISYAFTRDYIPDEAKNNLVKFLTQLGYFEYLKDKNMLL